MNGGTASRTAAAPPQSRAIGDPKYGPASDLAAPFKSWIHDAAWPERDTTTEEDITMYRFTQRFGRDSQARWRDTGPMIRGRRRNHRQNCGALVSRQLLSGYYIDNASSDMVLDDPSFSTSNGAVIQRFQFNGGVNQQWVFVPLAGGCDATRSAVRCWTTPTSHQQRHPDRAIPAQLRPEPAMADRPAGERQRCDLQRV